MTAQLSAGRRQLSLETIALIGVGVLFAIGGVFMCVSAYNAGRKPVVAAPVVAYAPMAMPALPPALAQSDDGPEGAPVFAPAPLPTSVFNAPLPKDTDIYPAEVVNPRPAPSRIAPARAASPQVFERPTSPSVVLGPSTLPPAPPMRPIELNAPRPKPTKQTEVASLEPSPPPRSSDTPYAPMPGSLSKYDKFTAVYELSSHTVYMPDGGRLEAHSGLAELKDDVSHVNVADRGATPPHLYNLTLREDLFHGVQALRLNPEGGPNSIFGRVGLLAHTYMLGTGGDSNGCVSFKNYDAFLAAFQSGQIRKLAVVGSLN